MATGSGEVLVVRRASRPQSGQMKLHFAPTHETVAPETVAPETVAPERTVSVAEAQAAFRRAVESGGTPVCPCCGRDGRLYRRRIDAEMVAVLIRLLHLGGDREWVHVGRIFPGTKATRGGGGWSRARFWDLIASADKRTESENSRGYWRLTDLGVAFVRGERAVPSSVIVWDNTPLRFSEDTTTARDALGKFFDYAELMAATVVQPETGGGRA